MYSDVRSETKKVEKTLIIKSTHEQKLKLSIRKRKERRKVRKRKEKRGKWSTASNIK